MVDFITTMMKRLGDYPIAWDIVNEAIDNSEQGYIKDSPWTLVDDYICKAYTAAKKANPNTQLYYNDYKYASSVGKYKNKSDKVFKLIKDLKDRNCGIDGVGF